MFQRSLPDVTSFLSVAIKPLTGLFCFRNYEKTVVILSYICDSKDVIIIESSEVSYDREKEVPY